MLKTHTRTQPLLEIRLSAQSSHGQLIKLIYINYVLFPLRVFSQRGGSAAVACTVRWIILFDLVSAHDTTLLFLPRKKRKQLSTTVLVPEINLQIRVSAALWKRRRG